MNMIGKFVEVIRGKHQGKKGFVKGFIRSDNAWRIESDKDGSLFQASVYFVIEKQTRKQKELNPRGIKEGDWVSARYLELEHIVHDGSREAEDTNYHLSKHKNGLVTLIYEEDDRLVANMVFQGTWAEIDVRALEAQKSRSYGKRTYPGYV